MPTEIKQAAVIGSGVMGSQIAAHIANTGVPVLFLDIVPKDAADRSMLAKGALEKLMQDEAAFVHPDNAKLITPGNIEDDFGKLKNVDWIVEAVKEDPQIKNDLFKIIDAARKLGSIVSSNTSTIPLSVLIGDQSEAFERDFLITHFFNPVRGMRLLELVTGPKSRADAIEIIRDFCDRYLGKSIVLCNDTPGFIANRLEFFFIQSAVNAAIDLDLTVEEADEVCGKLMGVPRTGVFGLLDLIGIDLLPLIGRSLVKALPPDDPYCKLYREPPLFQKMCADGSMGRKGKGGFYRIQKTGVGEIKESINLRTGAYALSKDMHPQTVIAAGNNLHALCDLQDKIGQFAWRVLSETLCYAFELVPATVADITAVDDAMRLGYAWKYGPFELIDQVGTGWLAARLAGESRPRPEFLRNTVDKTFYRTGNNRREFMTVEGAYAPVRRAKGVLLLSDVKRVGQPVASNDSASLWDIGDGVLCLEFTTKANAINAGVLAMIKRTIDGISESRNRWKGLVIYNEGENFSVGADLAFFREQIKNADWREIERLIKEGQALFHALRFAPFPTVSATSGMGLDSGCEIALHSSAVQAYTETSLGLVDANVGLIPGLGGCAQMLGRAFDVQKRQGSTVPPVSQVFETISAAKMSKSAAEARELGYLRPTDGITMNRDRLLYDAKQKVLELAKGYKPPEQWPIVLTGASGRSALDLTIESLREQGKASPHDVTVWKALAGVLCGDESSLPGPGIEEKVMEFECRAFMKLIRTPETFARIEYMLEKGKPLKN
jgi:3-hydroxyacyl-CoA dehydrogenase